MVIPWHRFLKICLRYLFKSTCYEVHDEFDVSDQKQLLDFAVIRKADTTLPEPDKNKLPDGLQDLKDHNLISYKSMSEPFDRYALNELVGHTVAYAKLIDPDNWKKFSDTLGLIALSTRKPSTDVMAKLLHETNTEAVYSIDCAGWQVTCVVINRTAKDPRNWIWQLLRGDRSRWKSGSISAILNQLNDQLQDMDILDPEAAAIERDILTTWAQELEADQLKQLPAVQAFAEEGLKKAASNLLAEGMPSEQVARLIGLPLDVVKELQS